MTSSWLVAGVLTFFASAAVAATHNVDYQPDIKLNIDELLSLPAENRREIAKSRGQEILPQLEAKAFAKDEDYGTRWKALILSAQIQGPKAEKTLKKAVNAPEWYMRNAALLAYQDVLPQSSRFVARNLLADKALVVRSAAVNVLAQKTSAEERELLWEEMTSKRNFRKKQSLFIRGQILTALAQAPVERELPLFVGCLKENDTSLHSPAILALEKITAKSLGKKNDSIDKKRELWLKWAKR